MSTVIPENYADLLELPALAHIATIGASGEPQSSPVWIGWDGEFIRFAQVGSVHLKLRNLERDPRVALSLVDPVNPFRYLEIRGTMVRIEPDPNMAFINAMTRKYLGQETYPFGKPDDVWRVAVIRPERTTQMG